MNDTKILPDDPKLTAYALGELEGEEQAAMEAAVNADPALRAAVDEIRAMGAQLAAVLEAEPVELATGKRGEGAASPGASAAKGRDAKPKAKSKLLRFPQLYFVIGGLAAACFALVFSTKQAEFEVKDARRAEKMAAEQKHAVEARARDDAMQRAVVVQMPAAAPAEVADANSATVALETFVVGADKKENTMSVMGGMGGARGIMLSASAQATFGAKAKVLDGTLSSWSAHQAVDGERSQHNTEAYAYQRENEFLGAAQNPLSTFSIDVDTAGYANVRRMLQQGVRPPADAVRIEELVNYFPYRYEGPRSATAATGQVSTAPFAASMEVAEAPWAPEHRLVRIGLKGREVSAAQRGAANLVFLLDVSGSMNAANKLPLVKESMRLLVGKLRPDDRVALVVYAGASGLALPSTRVAKLAEILAALDALTPGGSTNGAMGIELAYDIAKANFVSGGINRVVLCTDGDFNVGVTSEGELTRLIEEKAKSGVFLTVLGFGMGNYKDATLEKLADKGNGNYGYIDTRREAEKLLVEQVSGTLVTIAKDVKIQVEFNPLEVQAYRLIGYENRMLQKEDFNNDKIDAGEIGAGHTVTALYEVVPTGAARPESAGGVDALKYQRPAGPVLLNHAELLTLKVRYKEPAGDVSRKLEFPLNDRGLKFAEASSDFRFAAAVAGFGMVLRESPHKGTATLSEVEAWAREATDEDVGGYRGEFIGLVQQAEVLLK